MQLHHPNILFFLSADLVVMIISPSDLFVFSPFITLPLPFHSSFFPLVTTNLSLVTTSLISSSLILEHFPHLYLNSHFSFAPSCQQITFLTSLFSPHHFNSFCRNTWILRGFLFLYYTKRKHAVDNFSHLFYFLAPSGILS